MFQGLRGLFVLDAAATGVRGYIVAVMMQQWLARGIDGWRLARIIAPAGTAVLEGPGHGWEVAF